MSSLRYGNIPNLALSWFLMHKAGGILSVFDVFNIKGGVGCPYEHDGYDFFGVLSSI